MLLVGVAEPARAQVPLAAGKEARLYIRGVIRPLEGRLDSVGPEAVTIIASDGAQLTLSPAQLERSELLGSRANPVLGAAMGGAVGLGVGVWRVVKSRNDCEVTPASFCAGSGTRHEGWLMAVPAAIGAAAGALVGTLIRSSEWLPAYVPTVSSNGDAGVGLTWGLPAGS
jgi:hypothetical protein